MVLKAVLLSFDLEEFDMPLEYKIPIAFEQQISISREGTVALLRLLRERNLKATFFSTAVFAKACPDLITQIVQDGHELGSHSYYHSQFSASDLVNSRKTLQKISGTRVPGFRMPRMMPVSNTLLKEAGYTYNSSINPTLIVGRYNHLTAPRTIFEAEGMIQVPASVTPAIRFPLFWLSFHNLPVSFYFRLCKFTINRDNYLNLYFHPWEFADLSSFNFPTFVKKNSGQQMIRRFENLLDQMIEQGYGFSTISKFLVSSQKGSSL